MPQDDISALNAKMDFLIGAYKEQGEKIEDLQAQFNQSKGALWLIKFSAGVAVAIATVWTAWHWKM